MDAPLDQTAPHVTLEQWRALVAVVEAGSHARAAERLHKSQSAVTYAIQRLEQSLDVKVFQLQGRKSVLTETGRLLYRRAGILLNEAAALEKAADRLSAGCEPEIRLAADVVFPTWLLLDCLGQLTEAQPDTRIELFEIVLGGTKQALQEDRVDLAIGSVVPDGYLADPLLRLRFLAVAAPHHPLHQLDRLLLPGDLRRHTQLVLRDMSPKRRHATGWQAAERRWTVSHKATSIRAACLGHGFAWYPDSMIHDELASGALKPLPLREGAERHEQLYLIYRDRDAAGPGVMRLVQLLKSAAARVDMPMAG